MESKRQLKQEQKLARQQRVIQVARLYEILFLLASTYVIKPCVAHLAAQQRKFDSLAEKKNKQWRTYLNNLCALIQCQYFFQTSLDGAIITERCPKEIKKPFQKILKNYKLAVNWFNQWSAELRKISDLDCSSEFEKLIRSNAFPSYDITNGFETEMAAEAQVELIRNPHPVVVHSQVDDNEIALSADGESYPRGYDILRASRRTIIFATTDHAQFMSCLEYGIEQSTLVSPSDEPSSRSRRFLPQLAQTFGHFGDFSLLLSFGESSINSSCNEIKMRLISDSQSLDTYNLWCKRRIISLISIGSIRGVRVLFCGHAGCPDAEGWIFNTDPTVMSARLSLTHTQCPSGHAFCLRCFKPEHDGFCADTEAERQELLLLPHQKLCPTCKTIIFKDGGCNHMTCSRCRQDFCWLCNRKFTRSERYVQHAGCNQFD
jgi:hypothetical protein